jgi:hypothetical protein
LKTLSFNKIKICAFDVQLDKTTGNLRLNFFSGGMEDTKELGFGQIILIRSQCSQLGLIYMV